MDNYIKMDYSLDDPKDRVAKTEEIIASTPSKDLTSSYLTKMADYITVPTDKNEKKEKY